MSVSEVDKYLWLAYCKAVQNAVGGLPGHKPALFFTKKAQKAPVASPDVDPAYTNYGINNIINNFLQTNDLFFDPSHHKTYTQCLLEYLLSVKIGDGNQTRITMTGRTLTGALDQALRERERALDKFEKEEDHGLTGEQDFSQWWPSHAPAYSAAKSKVEAVAADYKALLLNTGGPAASQLARDFNRIIQALIGGQFIDGITMPACHASAEVTRELLEKDRTPHAITYVPEFMSPQYTSQIEHWMNGVGDGDSSMQINVADGNGKGSTNEKGLSFGSVDTDTNLDVQFSYDEIQTVAVPAGDWNVPSPGRRYQLSSTASEESRKLAFPDYLVVVRNLGFKISIRDDKLARQVDDMFEQAKDAGGSVRVFGIPATPEGNPDKATEENAHIAEWDRGNGMLLVRPTTDAGFASVVALVGELNISQ
ncbi:unnamed protein product [Fusarium graminearum]|uniref:Uncharacterized protein n=1 Tax=Gibberella zeae (strain ATCC MYA-4620 / CBS 123657 / FGSC 9075 / NRRL 31084 / PH-1) TaxID=229533 RepID=I1REA1_GIBZE|nr:hypothetical protein FGSG_01983 [Fusarium graminearum PH-1]ESU07361.1 hypothetical protein FGSG_01983 [Fusarium graminearum PH-1]EYB34469.1 hypothetical protein FG05_01983 [Fusarium graminearum]CZS77468.1 unnamed protein product [Fusarium graminearum]|eukprot:XP_011317846.1 hypothetical protein FGSG_01983 [Fusarium graminearum PH-1]